MYNAYKINDNFLVFHQILISCVNTLENELKQHSFPFDNAAIRFTDLNEL